MNNTIVIPGRRIGGKVKRPGSRVNELPGLDEHPFHYKEVLSYEGQYCSAVRHAHARTRLVRSVTWFKVDDNLAFNAKVVKAGNAAMGLWVRAGSWSAQQLTEGFIPWHIVDALGTRKQANALCNSGLWTSGAEGCQFWQWSEEGRQPTRESVLNERAAAKERQRRAREKAAASRRDSAVTDAVTTPVVTVPPSRPVPSRPTTGVNDVSPVSETGSEAPDGLDSRSAIFGFDGQRVRRELTRVLAEFPDESTVMHVATTILRKATTWPDNPTAYVIGSIRKSEFEVQQIAGGAA